MKKRRPINSIVMGTGLIAAALMVDGWLPIGIAIKDAHAVVGRPMTPGSVAGVARRTTRRTIRRSAVYVSTLPAACRTVVIDGTSLYSCGGTYYQPYGGRYAVVYVD
ncbi:DUF6515 family protein [Thiocapsa marina]|uniref:Uncharacterized protein n=1 Tax=Thiocapsa marina 5811 TaxID=768671 RepID=F9UEE8_9GAMM|nr:DUF6515 family protein [Thiocapsa marina]EGV17269.1 hypothetical protein ThimaDRAFT_3301 [Thiocapsa marina 5811]